MGCLTHRRKAVNVGTDQNWSYINLKDFKSTSCFTPFAYGYLWLMLLTSLTVYGVDTFVAVNLLAFDSWSSQIDPGVDRDIAKWVFSVCIIASFVNLAFEHFRAWRVMRRGNVAECYLDSLAVRLESIRMGKGQGWRRFLVFASLTKSKKGAEYIALFTYFSFQSWIRVLICSGPRQVINALTLYGVYTTDLGGGQAMSIDRSFVNLWETIQKLADENLQQVVILFGMAFTLIIWAFSALFLIIAILFYVLFLWHWIPRADGGLGGYCERKVNKALVKIVTKKVNKALAKEQEDRMRANYKADGKGLGEKPSLGRQATLPTIPDLGPGLGGGDKLPEMPSLSRADTFATLPPYASRPGTPGSIELNAIDQKRPLPSRAGTTTSNPYSTRAGLMASASDMGTSSPLSPAQSMPSIDFSQYGQGPLRTNSPSVHGSFSGPSPSNPSLRHQPSNSSSSFGARYTETPSNYGAVPFPAPSRSPSTRPDGYGNPGPLPQNGNFSPRSATNRPNVGPFSPVDGRGSPAPSVYSTRSGPTLPRNPNQGYQPARSATGPAPYRPQQQQQQQPTRNMTTDYYGGQQQPSQGSGNGYDYDAESQRGGRY